MTNQRTENYILANQRPLLRSRDLQLTNQRPGWYPWRVMESDEMDHDKGSRDKSQDNPHYQIHQQPIRDQVCDLSDQSQARIAQEWHTDMSELKLQAITHLRLPDCIYLSFTV